MAASQLGRLDISVIGGAECAALAELIADDLEERLTPRIVQLIEILTRPGSLASASPEAEPDSKDGSSNAPTLWSARQVATHYSVTPNFVYQHADELGCIRLGGGPRPRLRFDPCVVRERWHRVSEMPSTTAPRRRSSKRPTAPRRRRTYALLDYDRER